METFASGQKYKTKTEYDSLFGRGLHVMLSLLLLASLWNLCTSLASVSVFHTHASKPSLQLGLSALSFISELNHKKQNTNVIQPITNQGLRMRLSGRVLVNMLSSPRHWRNNNKSKHQSIKRTNQSLVLDWRCSSVGRVLI